MENINDAIEFLPQKKPFLFIDNVVSVSNDQIECGRTFKEDEFFYKGHFPENPITPGVLLMECMAQSAQLLCTINEEKQQFGYLVRVDKCSFHKLVEPNSSIKIITTRDSSVGEFCCFRSLILNQNNKKVAKSKFTLRIIDDRN